MMGEGFIYRGGIGWEEGHSRGTITEFAGDDDWLLSDVFETEDGEQHRELKARWDTDRRSWREEQGDISKL